jgi:hypothetical protein
MGGYGGVTTLIMNLSQGQLKYKKGSMMRTSLPWIQLLFYGIRVGHKFRLQNDTNLQLSPQRHMNSNMVVLVLNGKIIKYIFRRIQPHVHSLLESDTIINLIHTHILNTIYSFLYTFNDDVENILLPDNVIMIKKHEEYKKGLEDRHRDAQDQ